MSLCAALAVLPRPWQLSGERPLAVFVPSNRETCFTAWTCTAKLRCKSDWSIKHQWDMLWLNRNSEYLLKIENDLSLPNHRDITSPPESIQAADLDICAASEIPNSETFWLDVFPAMLRPASSHKFPLWHYILCSRAVSVFFVHISGISVCVVSALASASFNSSSRVRWFDRESCSCQIKESEGTNKLGQRGQQWTKHNHIVTNIAKLKQPSCSSSGWYLIPDRSPAYSNFGFLQAFTT